MSPVVKTPTARSAPGHVLPLPDDDSFPIRSSSQDLLMQPRRQSSTVSPDSQPFRDETSDHTNVDAVRQTNIPTSGLGEHHFMQDVSIMPRATFGACSNIFDTALKLANKTRFQPFKGQLKPSV